MVATDGWKCKACEQGASLVNCIILKPSGGAIFHSVHNVEDSKKKSATVVAEVRVGSQQLLLSSFSTKVCKLMQQVVP